MNEDDLAGGESSESEVIGTEDQGVSDGDPDRIEIFVEDEDLTMEEEIARLQDEIADLRDRSTRTLADFENYRKRVEKERRDERRYAAAEVLHRVLEVVDNLERALAAEGGAEDLKTGVELILRQLLELLRSSGARRVPAVGQEFDPNFHEAVARYEDPEVAVPTVSEEMQAGYRFHDRLLRPAIVRVAMPVEGGSVEPGSGDAGAAEEELESPESTPGNRGPRPIH